MRDKGIGSRAARTSGSHTSRSSAERGVCERGVSLACERGLRARSAFRSGDAHEW
jgi:hypothetical protein